MPDHRIDRLPCIDRANTSARMGVGEDPEDLVDESLADGIDVPHVQFDVGELVEIVHQAFGLGKDFRAPIRNLDYDENGNRETLIENSTTYNYTITAYTNLLALKEPGYET
jgi:hypothetical protein